MFKKICALLRKKPVETKLPDFPIEVPTKKELVKKASTRKPVAKKATIVAKKTTTKKKK
jgi:hypothetical protein